MDSPIEVNLPRTDFYSLHKEVRNGACRYNPESIVRMAMCELYEPVPNKLEDLRRAPWQMLLLVKWICQDNALDSRAPDITAEAFYKLPQAIWSIPERLEGIGDILPGYLFFRQLLHPQAAMQRRFSSGFVREAVGHTVIQGVAAIRSQSRHGAFICHLAAWGRTRTSTQSTQTATRSHPRRSHEPVIRWQESSLRREGVCRTAHLGHVVMRKVRI